MPIAIDLTVIIARAVTGLVDWNTTTIAIVGEMRHTFFITWLTDCNALIIAFPKIFRTNFRARFFAF